MDSQRTPKEYFDDAAPLDFERFNSEFSDILRDIDEIIDHEQPDDHSGDRGVSAWDKQTSPTVSPIIESREETRKTVVPPQTPSSPLPRPQDPPVSLKTKSSVGRAWSGLKKMLVKKFWGGRRSLPMLSDGLVPSRDDEVRLGLGRFPGGGFIDIAKKPALAGPIKARTPQG